MMQSEARKEANDTQKNQGEEHCVVGSGGRHTEALGLVYSAHPEYLSQPGIIHCDGTKAAANS